MRHSRECVDLFDDADPVAMRWFGNSRLKALTHMWQARGHQRSRTALSHQAGVLVYARGRRDRRSVGATQSSSLPRSRQHLAEKVQLTMVFSPTMVVPADRRRAGLIGAIR
jgi:hypothetical protein